ncbi:MAG: OB-fold domain-containing protein [Proteobacteria bacterium]|nr:OB-fold domain-containing protein [Pseudomonadota bacterium]
MNAASADYGKPLPAGSGLAGEFYRWCAQGELRFQRCSDCGHYRHVPRELCAHCGSPKWVWAPSSGRGKVFSWTEVVRPLHPAFAADAPYAPVIVEMEEGVRMLSRMLDCAPGELAIGMPVALALTRVGAEACLPCFRRAD